MRVLSDRDNGDILDVKGPQVKEGRLRKVMVTLGDRSMTMQTGTGAVGQNVINGWKWHQGSDHRIRGRGMGKTRSLSLKQGTRNMMELTDIDVLLRDAADLCRKNRQMEARRVGVHSGVSQGTGDLSCFDTPCSRCDLPSDPCFISRG